MEFIQKKQNDSVRGCYKLVLKLYSLNNFSRSSHDNIVKKNKDSFYSKNISKFFGISP